MDERNEVERVDEVILPGFRFHPTDEELVGFYLKRKVQQKPLSIELIRQINIYKYDPWDLPKLATTGEKEWYFYCPRDRKYRNSARPNRVTGAGFWKATGTDRPIYSSEGSKCIGLKKSLVFYKGRAAKGIKTDWMMHEFRLPSLTDTSLPKRTTIDKNIPANDSWAICRIFKKTNSMVQRTISQSWVSPLTETTSSNLFSIASSCTTTDASIPTINFNNTTFQQQSTTYPTLDTNPYKPINLTHPCKPPTTTTIPNQQDIVPFMFTNPSIPTLKHDIATMLLNMPPTIFEDVDRSSTSTIDFGQQQQQCCINGFSGDLPPPMNINMGVTSAQRNQLLYLETMRNAFNNTSTSSCPFTMTTNPTTWDSPSCPSELSGSYNSSKFNC